MPEMIERKRNWAPWIGLLLALAAVLSNFVFFLPLPGQKTIPVLSVLLAVLAAYYALKGVTRAYRQPEIYSGKVSSAILGVLSILIFALVSFGAIQFRKLPSGEAAPQVGQKVPDFTLSDTNGSKVSLSQLLGGVNASNTMAAANTAA